MLSAEHNAVNEMLLTRKYDVKMMPLPTVSYRETDKKRAFWAQKLLL